MFLLNASRSVAGDSSLVPEAVVIAVHAPAGIPSGGSGIAPPQAGTDDYEGCRRRFSKRFAGTLAVPQAPLRAGWIMLDTCTIELVEHA